MSSSYLCINLSTVIKLSLYEIYKKNPSYTEKQLRDKLTKVFYKFSKKNNLPVIWNGNFSYPYSQDIEDVFYELVICGQPFTSDFSYLEKYASVEDMTFIESIKFLI